MSKSRSHPTDCEDRLHVSFPEYGWDPPSQKVSYSIFCLLLSHKDSFMHTLRGLLPTIYYQGSIIPSACKLFPPRPKTVLHCLSCTVIWSWLCSWRHWEKGEDFEENSHLAKHLPQRKSLQGLQARRGCSFLAKDKDPIANNEEGSDNL